MRLLLRLLVPALLVAALAFCGGSEEYDDTAQNEKEMTPQASQTETKKAPVTSKVNEEKRIDRDFVQEISLDNDLFAKELKLKVRVKTKSEMKSNQRMTFNFWKNGEILQENSVSDSLTVSPPKSGDSFYAEVLIFDDDELVFKERTELLNIENSPPVFKDIKFPDIKGTGEYYITLKAEDPDGDNVTFSLDPMELPVEISIDPATGRITCKLTKDTPERLSFVVVADDGNGGITKRELSMNFFKQAPESGE